MESTSRHACNTTANYYPHDLRGLPSLDNEILALKSNPLDHPTCHPHEERNVTVLRTPWFLVWSQPKRNHLILRIRADTDGQTMFQCIVTSGPACGTPSVQGMWFSGILQNNHNAAKIISCQVQIIPHPNDGEKDTPRPSQ